MTECANCNCTVAIVTWLSFHDQVTERRRRSWINIQRILTVHLGMAASNLASDWVRGSCPGYAENSVYTRWGQLFVLRCPNNSQELSKRRVAFRIFGCTESADIQLVLVARCKISLYRVRSVVEIPPVCPSAHFAKALLIVSVGQSLFKYYTTVLVWALCNVK